MQGEAPEGYRLVALPFPLQEGERIIALFRRHWWFLWPRTILLALVALVPAVAATLLLDLAGVLDDLGVWYWLLLAAWLLYWALQLFLNWYRYRHDIWVVTNQRVIDSYKPHPFSLRVSTADLVNVQDMSVVKQGLTPTLLNYGTIVCETAGSAPQDFLISGVPRPEQVQLLIDRERDRERRRLAPGV
jgi:hypothetical protein